MKRRSRLAAILITILMLTIVVSSVPASAATAGGWSVSKARYSFLTSGQQKIFNKAVKKVTGVSYQPVALLAKQVVAGTNYVFLCQGTTVTAKPKKAWYVLTAYKDLNKKVTLSSVKKIKLGKIKVNENPRGEILEGGLKITKFKNKPAALSAPVRIVFNKGIENFTGNELRPIALLGTQVVSGMNHKFLCYGTGAAGADLYVVDIYLDLEGNCSLTNCAPLNLEAYVN